MLCIAVCDDEQLYLDRTNTMLEQYVAIHHIECVIKTYCNPSKLLDSIEGGEHHDIYLLDIYMPGVSGMSIATELRSKGIQSPIIFLTSSTEHAIEAFGVDAIHYLLKPYTQQNFFAAINKAMQSISAHSEESIVLKIKGEYQNIPVNNLLYCEAADNHQRIWMEDGTHLLVRMTASELYKTLLGFSHFHRCGRAYILNLNQIKKVTTNSAVLKNDYELYLPRTVIAQLRSAFFNHFN